MADVIEFAAAVDVTRPAEQTSPIVVASPHAGSAYPSDLIEASALSRGALRRSEDCYVDELFAAAPDLGAPMIRALLPRAYLDLNREPYELDPAMFSDALPDFVNTTSPRVAAGLGTIARVVGNQKEIYARKLTWGEAEIRIDRFYKPYHEALQRLIQDTCDLFGYCVLLDCHSMPSAGLPANEPTSASAIDIVLGDRNGLSCARYVTQESERLFGAMGYSVIRNNPYAGGFTTQNYGNPKNGVHALQIEVNRALYVDETSLRRRPAFGKLKADLRQFVQELSHFALASGRDLMYQRLSAE
jgi:N-formylglutamate amidohydrolase